MPKQGVRHDYDLMANREGSARENECVVCGADPVTYRWTDLSGEAVCTRCGTPYQLKWGSDDQKEEGDYPYINLKDEWIPVVREWWGETERFVPLGRFMGVPREEKEASDAFYGWVEENHPELLED